MRGARFKLLLMTIISLPLLFHLLLVGAALFSSKGNADAGSNLFARNEKASLMSYEQFERLNGLREVAEQSWGQPFLAASSNTTSDPVFSATLWQRYVLPQEQWPPLAVGAADDLQPLPAPPTQDPELVRFGAQLFHDPGLSRDGKVSCASCHKSSHGFADTERVTPGVDGLLGKRNAQSLLDVHLWDTLFWDGRAANLEEQAHMPLEDPVEMASTRQHAVDYVSDKYGESAWSEIARALSAFQRTLTLHEHPDNRLDQFLWAVDDGDVALASSLLTDQELHGLHLFRTKAGCIRCHSGALLSDQEFHVTGFHYYGRRFEDLGRWEHEQRIENLAAFRTPMLRGLMQHQPWMHNGLFDDLRGIIRQYSHGGPHPRRPDSLPLVMPYPETTDELVPFSLTREEEDALLVFLQML